MPGRKRCVVVADARSARILLAPGPGGESFELTEHSELENCSSAIDENKRALPCSEQELVKLDGRFSSALAQHIRAVVDGWQCGSVVIAATPGTLGLLREAVQRALPEGVSLKALAKDYVSLSTPELAERLHF